MKVDGAAFREARLRIKAENKGVETLPNHPRIGTQDWVADEAGVSVRLIKDLEKGDASIKTLKRVSSVLGMGSHEQYIVEYALAHLDCSANSHIDFRPKEYPPGNTESFQDSVVLMTIDPLAITAKTGKINSFILKEVTARLKGLQKEIPFFWLSEVSLTHDIKNDWLGRIRQINEICIDANDKTLYIPIQFKQDDASHVSWGEFVGMVEDSSEAQLNIEVELRFARFTKQISFHISMDHLKSLFQQGREKYHSVWPYRVQLRTMC